MPQFSFENFALTTLMPATDAASGAQLTDQQKAEIVSYLKSPGSGPDGVTSYEDFVNSKLRSFPAELPFGVDYVAFSGTDSFDKGNYFNATDYGKSLQGRAGIIGDTPWGKYIEEIVDKPEAHPDFHTVADKFQAFMDARGFKPMGNGVGALQDMMWNAGSPKFFENAIATGKPLVAFVENAKPERGFHKFELATALDHPNVRINGYPISAFGPEPLAFASAPAC